MKRQVVGLILVSLLVPACGVDRRPVMRKLGASGSAGALHDATTWSCFLLSQLPPGYELKVENDASSRECSEGLKDWQVAFREEILAEGLLACRNATYEKQGARFANAPASGAMLFDTAAGASNVATAHEGDLCLIGQAHWVKSEISCKSWAA